MSFAKHWGNGSILLCLTTYRQYHVANILALSGVNVHRKSGRGITQLRTNSLGQLRHAILLMFSNLLDSFPICLRFLFENHESREMGNGTFAAFLSLSNLHDDISLSLTPPLQIQTSIRRKYSHFSLSLQLIPTFLPLPDVTYDTLSCSPFVSAYYANREPVLLTEHRGRRLRAGSLNLGPTTLRVSLLSL